MRNFFIEMKADEKFSKPTIRVSIDTNDLPDKHSAAFIDKLNMYLCQKWLISEDRHDSEKKFFYEPSAKQIKFYVQNENDLKDVLKQFPKGCIFRPYFLDDSHRGAAGPTCYINRAEVYDYAKILLDETRENFTKNAIPEIEDKNLKLNVSFNNLAHPFNKIYLSHNTFPVRICFSKTVDNDDFFKKEGRMDAVKNYIAKEFENARNVIKAGEEIDCMVGRVMGENTIQLAASSYKHIEKFLAVKTATGKESFRNVKFFFEGKEISKAEIKELSAIKKTELINEFEGKETPTRSPRTF